MFLREHEYASEMGFDGSVCNEHHNNVLSIQESVNISAAVISQRVKGTIALIGNPLPIQDLSRTTVCPATMRGPTPIDR